MLKSEPKPLFNNLLAPQPLVQFGSWMMAATVTGGNSGRNQLMETPAACESSAAEG
jgi:hypothetical protein